MRFAKWLYHLDGVDQLIVAGFFIFSIGLSYLSINIFRFWYERIQQKGYSREFRITPFFLLFLAMFYASMLYLSIGENITYWIRNF